MAGGDDDDERFRQPVRALLATGDLDELSVLKICTLVEASMGVALTETQRRMVRDLAYDRIAFNGGGAAGTCASVPRATEPAGAADDRGANVIAFAPIFVLTFWLPKPEY
eukprot:SM000003S11098  [mRNA]  locus=s3:833931:835360:- [translate_table: standard]